MSSDRASNECCLVCTCWGWATERVCSRDAGDEWWRKCCACEEVGETVPPTLKGPPPGVPALPYVESAELSLEWETMGAGDCLWAGGVKKEAGKFLILKGFCKGIWLEGFNTQSNNACNSLSLLPLTCTTWLPLCSTLIFSSLTLSVPSIVSFLYFIKAHLKRNEKKASNSTHHHPSHSKHWLLLIQECAARIFVCAHCFELPISHIS